MQLITRAAAVLRALEGQSAGLSLGQIAKASGLPRPTVQRIVDALCVEGLAKVDPRGGGVFLGPMITRLATSVRIDLVALARPHLERLATTTQGSAAMTVLQDGQVVVIALVTPPTQMIRLTANIGSTWPLHSSAEGKALLSGLPEATIRKLLPRSLEARTPNTITELPRLLKELSAGAQSGILLDREGTGIGISAIAARIVDASGGRYAISVLLPTSRFDADLPHLTAELAATRDLILREAGLSARVPPPDGRAAHG
ncbi:IclR family transcriptional regulator [Roseomonas sp. NAR14]|uniref:IclR family transcriptional regulator n=1 Tax=Roseomonas acroporae TaxID=2937791 RepID=A0A9X2BW52_9PROT|nr:IclR family transcriptional regulator [Roseomonas acroporae]MCK8787362.1 IclR family transcriptional regulator [Roseomonas acroporae]